MTRKQLLQTQHQFRTIQILHMYLMNEVLKQFLPALILILFTLLVAVLFSFIRFHNSLNRFAQISFTGYIIIITFISKFVTKLMADVLTACEGYKKSFDVAKSTSKFLVTKEHEAFLKACQLLEIKIGMFCIENNVFLILVAEVFATTFNLLVSV